MNKMLKNTMLLAGAIALAGCSSAPEPPVDYTAGESSLPAINELVELEETFAFDETTNDDGTVVYSYSELPSGMQTAQAYAEALKESWNCRILSDLETGSDASFSLASGQAVAVCETDGGEEDMVLTIQWGQNFCSVTPSLMDSSEVPAPTPSPTTVTLEEAVDELMSFSPQQLGLSGESMEEYLAFAQDGTVLLDNTPCICVNVYLAQTHRFEETYLLTLPNLSVFRLDRASGQAVALS